MYNYLNSYTPNREIELLNMIFQAFIIAIIVSIYANSVPSFHTFNFFKELVYGVFNLSFLWTLHLLYKIQYDESNYYRKNVKWALISILFYILISYILTIDTTENMFIYMKENHIFSGSVLYLMINMSIIFILCYFTYTNNIHKDSIGTLENIPFNVVGESYDNMTIFYIVILFITPLLLFIFLNFFLNTDYIMVTPFLTFSTFLILFTVFIPKSMSLLNSNIDSSLDTLGNIYYEE